MLMIALFTSDNATVQKAMEKIRKHIEIKRSQGINYFIGCKSRREGETVFLSLPNLI
jgi:intergrase/recombinase